MKPSTKKIGQKHKPANLSRNTRPVKRQKASFPSQTNSISKVNENEENKQDQDDFDIVEESNVSNTNDNDEGLNSFINEEISNATNKDDNDDNDDNDENDDNNEEKEIYTPWNSSMAFQEFESGNNNMDDYEIDNNDFFEKDEFDILDIKDNDTKKLKLMDDDDDDDDKRKMQDDEEEEEMEIEKLARREEKANEQIQKDIENELKEEKAQRAPLKTNFKFPSYKKLLQEKNEPPDLPKLKKRMEDIIFILSNFKELRDIKHTRKEYLSLLSHAITRYFGYSLDLMNMLLTIFSPSECLAFVQSNEIQRPLTIRVNTLKTRRRDLAKLLIDRGVNIDPLSEWSKEGLKIVESNIPIGATPEYLSGYYMIQSAASLLPVMALDVKPQQKILDVAAAPGGKTTHIGQLLKNTGLIVANDTNKERLKAVFGNIHRMGIANCIITNIDGRELNKHYHPIFDRVLLDAPCSCLGVISRDSQIKYNKNFNDVTKMSVLQQELILSAIDCLKVGGYIVYSTCSISPYENENVVNYALQQRHVKIVDCGLTFGIDGFTKFKHMKFDSSLKKTKRFYPHKHNLDGFYVAKLLKVDKGARGQEKKVQTLFQQELNQPDFTPVTLRKSRND